MGLIRTLARGLFGLSVMLGCFTAAVAQLPKNVQPVGVPCIVSAGNRNAPLAADGTYTVYGIPAELGAIRARVTCADGTVGQSEVVFTNPVDGSILKLGAITFGAMDPVPLAVGLTAPQRQLTSGEQSQLTATAVNADGTTHDVTPRADGSVYAVSNTLLTSVTEDGMVSVHPDFASSSSSRVVASVITEGSLAATYVYHLGPTGTLTGTVVESDGTTAAPGAVISIMRLQPLEQAGSVVSGIDGRFTLPGVSAGTFNVSAINPATGDRAHAVATIAEQGENVDVTLRFQGLGEVEVTVLGGTDTPVPSVEVTYTALGSIPHTRSALTDASGRSSFPGVPTGQFTVSARDAANRLVGTALAEVDAGDVTSVTLRLQPVGALEGQVLGSDGTTVQPGVLVRLSSRERGIVSQAIAGASGDFSFDTLPISDGPFTLDALVGGRLQGRASGIVFSAPNETLVRNVVLEPMGRVQGSVMASSGPVADALVTLQSTEGMRPTFQARSDSEGRFAFPSVPVGDFDLRAVTPNGQIGTAAGRVSEEGETVVLDVAILDEGVTGTVFERDGVTPVAAGVTVYLAPKSEGSRYTYENTAGAISTQTDAAGRFAFTLNAVGSYYVQAEDGLDRGRSELTVVTLNATQPIAARVTYLGKGQVSGTVRNTAGQVQPGAAVTVRSEGAFTVDRHAVTDANGRYAIPGVFVGDLVATAQNGPAELGGQSTGRLVSDADEVVLDITLAATASVSGRVLERDGTVVASRVRLTVSRDGVHWAESEFPDGSAYSFPTVPVGQIKVEAEVVESGDSGVATTRIASANDDKVLDVRLVGQGALTVSLVDSQGAPVAGARVTVSGSGPFAGIQEGESDGAGLMSFDRVAAGDFAVQATKELELGVMTGSASGTLVAGTTQPVEITMSTLSVGRVSGTVLGPDGVTPVGAGWVVRMLPEPFPDAFVTTTDAQGSYAFESVPVGTYSADALRFYTPGGCPNRDRIRGRNGEVAVIDEGDDVEADIQLIGQGSVRGQVTDSQGLPVSGIDVRLTNPDTTYGLNVTCNGRTTYDRTTDSQGRYELDDVPPGDFTITAENTERTQRAEAADRIALDGDQAVVDMVLVSNAVTMPVTLHDANGVPFGMSGDGSIASGLNAVFNAPSPDTAAMRLDIVRNGVAVPFVNGNGTLGRLSKGGQQVDVDDVTPSGLFVTREMFVPRAGYFARYREVLSNPTNAAITVNVRVRSHHRSAMGTPRVVDTSDGDTVISVVGGAADTWALVDDQLDGDPFANPASIPVSGHLFDGNDGAAAVGAASYELVGPTGRLTYEWQDITVEPGTTVSFVHFVFHQLGRSAGRAAAVRLAQLPPEAFDDLTTDERASVRNFAVPEQSPLTPLPNLDSGRIDGHVYSGDGVSVVPDARVYFKSKHPLFGRERSQLTDAAGRFDLRSRLDGSSGNQVIPVHGFDLRATFPPSAATSATASGEFPAGATAVTQDLIFVGYGDIRGRVERHDGAPVPTADVRLCRAGTTTCQDGQTLPENSATGDASGAFALLANAPRDYVVFADKAHPQRPRLGQARPIRGQGPVTVTAGDVVDTVVTMEPTGTIGGTVLGGNGLPVVDAWVDLILGPGPGGGAVRGMRTDTAGRYLLVDVPVGQHRLRALDATSEAQGSATASVTVDVQTTANITLVSSGEALVQVLYARGATAANALVTDGRGGSTYSDTNGRVTLQLPQGTHNLRASHPDNRLNEVLRGSAPVTIATPGEQVPVTITLGAAGSVVGTVVRPDGTTLAGGFPYTLRQLSGNGDESRDASTSGTGGYRQDGLPLGHYLLTAYDAEQDRYADAEFELTVDGEEVTVDLTLLDNRIPLPANLFDANRFRFDVQRSGALMAGGGAFNGAAVALAVNGQAYVGETSARLEAERRQFLIAQPDLVDGLKVSRRVYVPRGAYYARYLEIIENPSSEVRTVNVALQSNLKSSSVLGSSSGDATVSNEDSWVTFDDIYDADILMQSGQVGPSGFVFAGAAGAGAPDAVEVQTMSGNPMLTQRWDGLVVPAHGRVVLLHFVVQQINRAGVAAAVERLALLPPEALEDLGSDDRAAIINFVLPAEGESTVDALPALTATIEGIALEGDERTPVLNAYLTVQSEHPLFNRAWGYISDSACAAGTAVGSLLSSSVANGGNGVALGSFALRGQLTEHDSVALPEGVPVRLSAQESRSCFVRRAGHPVTRFPSRVETVLPSVVQNVVWDTGVVTGSLVGTADFSVTSGRLYRSTDDRVFGSRPILPDGTFTYPGLPAGVYDFVFETVHPNGVQPDILRGQRVGLSVPVGVVTVADIQLQPTGRVQGTVVKATGELVVGARLMLSGAAVDQTYDQCVGCVSGALSDHRGKRAVQREVVTDSLGRYTFNTVPTGSYTLTAVDPVSTARVPSAVVVSPNQTTSHNVTLPVLGRAEVLTLLASGQPMVDAVVRLTATGVEGEVVAGRTDAQGRVTVANIPAGPYQLRVRDRRYSSASHLQRTAEGTIAAQGQVDSHTLTFSVAAAVSVQVIDSNPGGGPLAGASVELTDSRGTMALPATNASGTTIANAVPGGSVSIRARAMVSGVQRQSVVPLTLGLPEDGTTVPVTIDMATATTTINVQVLGDDGQPFARETQVLFQSEDVFANLNTNANGAVTYVYVGNTPLRVTAWHPDTSTIRATEEVVPANGQVRNITLSLASGMLEGVVRAASGAPAPGTYIDVLTQANYAYAASAYSDSNGHYITTPLGTAEPLLLRVRDPDNYAGLETPVTVVAGQTTVQDLTLPGRASIDVTVSRASGGALSNAYVRADFQAIPGNTASLTSWGGGTTDGNGKRSIHPLPTERPIRVVATYTVPGSGSTVSAENTVVIPEDGDVISVPLVMEIPGSTVRATVSTADGLPVSGTCYLTVTPGVGDGSYTTGDCGQPLSLGGVLPGVHSATVYGSSFYKSDIEVTVGTSGTVQLDVVLSVVTGTVRFADGTPVPSANVDITDTASNTRYAYADEGGQYRVLDIGMGAFHARAIDNESGLTGETAGELVSPAIPVSLDITLPPSGNLEGTVRRADGSNAAAVEVIVANFEHGLQRYAETDAEGAYRIERIALGEVEGLAVNAAYTNIARNQASLSADGATVTMDFDFAETGSVEGEVTSAGVVVPMACVDLHPEAGSELGMYGSTEADHLGNYAFDEVMPGRFTVLARECMEYSLAGMETGTVEAGTTVQRDISIGNALTLPRNLTDSLSGYTIVVHGTGQLGAGILPYYENSIFNLAPELLVNDAPYPSRPAALQAQGGRQLDIGPVFRDGLVISRSIWVPEGGGYVRLVESFTNATATTQTVPWQILGMHMSGELLVEPPPTLVSRYVLQADSVESGAYTPGIAGYVMSGSAAQAPTQTNFSAGQGEFAYGWTPTIAPGQTVRFAHFIVVRQPGGLPDAQAQAEAIATMAQPGMFDGIPNEQRADIINFTVPQQ